MKTIQPVIYGVSPLTDLDVHLFREGTHTHLFDKLGAHVTTHKGIKGVHFAVWAPNAEAVHVIGDFNGWNCDSHPLSARWDNSGIWEGFVPNIGDGTLYKYSIATQEGQRLEKCDPFAFQSEIPPRTASVVRALAYKWKCKKWEKERVRKNRLDAPITIYELHLGSWRHHEGRSLTYRELAEQLPAYVEEMGFTHVEFLPVMEHPFFGSWGYQSTGYFAPTSRFGTAQEFMALIDALHMRGISVILDWVPAHFPNDSHSLALFDGTHLYEHADPKEGFHPDWKSAIFNFGRHEVRAFLLSSALFWLKVYNIDGLRVDAVASMIYRNYSRKEGEWVPNIHGGIENLEAISFLQQLNAAAYEASPHIQMMAEESTAWPNVSKPVWLGGLGFGLKWNMGWMHDTLSYFAKDPIYRKHHHSEMLFSLCYAFTENFLLPLSHDEVVHGKGGWLTKLSGMGMEKFSTLRLLFGYMFGHPGKKLLFMGGEFGQWDEWHHDKSLDWHLLDYPPHQGIQQWVRDLNHLYAAESPLFADDFTPDGFQWIDLHDYEKSIISFQRIDPQHPERRIVVVCNFTPVPHYGYRIGVPLPGVWQERLNSDAAPYGGSNMGNFGSIAAEQIPMHGHAHSLSLTLPPLSTLFFSP